MVEFDIKVKKVQDDMIKVISDSGLPNSTMILILTGLTSAINVSMEKQIEQFMTQKEQEEMQEVEK